MPIPDEIADLVFAGDIEEISQLLQKNPSLAHEGTDDGDTLLHLACWAKQLGIIGTLLNYDPALDARGCYGRTPLHYAVHEGNAISPSIVATLLGRGANPTIRDNNGFTPADWAKIEMTVGLREALALFETHGQGLEEINNASARNQTMTTREKPTTGQLRDRLAELTSLDAPVGFEEPVLRFVADQLKPLCAEVTCDVRGNVYGRLPGRDPNAPLVMLTAHADEIGFMVTSVRPDGFLRFTKLGHPTDMVLPGQRVRVLAREPLEGVIGVKPGHVLSPDEARRTPAIDEMYIDVGATSAAEAVDWGVEPGTPAVFVGELTSTKNPARVFGKCVDNRAGVLCVLEAARRLAADRPQCSVAFVIVVEEEVGLRGAEVAARKVQPDVLIAIDTVPSGGTPDLPPGALPWTIGAGPLLKVRETKGLSTHGPLRALVRETAAAEKIPVQVIVDTAGITDATSAQQASGDVAAMVIGLARRYSHSAVELCDLSDVQAIIDLTVATVRNIRNREQLQRITI
jgi:endoglucanase